MGSISYLISEFSVEHASSMGPAEMEGGGGGGGGGESNRLPVL